MNKIARWFGEARIRAQRRKSPWNLLLGLVVVLSIAFVWFSSCEFILYLPHDSTVSFREISAGYDLQMIFVTIPMFFPSLAWGMVLGDAIMWLVPPARRIFEQEAQGHKGSSFKEVMSGLPKFAFAVIAIPIALFASYQIRL